MAGYENEKTIEGHHTNEPPNVVRTGQKVTAIENPSSSEI
jgi:hypothetical protein